MKVSKGQHLKAKRKCLSAAATEVRQGSRRLEQILRRLNTNVFLNSVEQHVPLKIKHGVGLSLAKEHFLFAKMSV